METGIFQIDLKDGRVFKIFYANSTQKRRLMYQFSTIKDKIASTRTIANGINTVKEFEQLLKTI